MFLAGPSLCVCVKPKTMGMCPDWELSLQPLVYETTLQPTEPYHPGLAGLS